MDCFFFQAEDGIRDLVRSRGLGDVYKRQVCFFALPGMADLGPQTGLAVMVMGSFGIAVTQGGLGAYQIIVSGVLVLYGVDYMLAYAFSWLAWGAQTLLVIFGGFLAMIALPLVNRNISTQA